MAHDLKFLRYARKLTNSGDRDAIHAEFQIGIMKDPFGEGTGPLILNMTKAGLEHRINTKIDTVDDRLLLTDILLNWPDDETEANE